MKTKNTKGLKTESILTAAGLLLACPMFATAAVVYDTTAGPTTAIDQQFGNAYSNIGDTATITPTGVGQTLSTISIPFVTTYYSGTGTPTTPFDYTPDVTLDLYPTATDAAAGTNSFGSAVVNNVSFHNDGTNLTHGGGTFNVEDQQNLTFDFTTQNISLPATFAFAYHDNPAPSDYSAAGGISVLLSSSGATTGLADPAGYFYTYNGILDNPVAPSFPTTGYNVEATVNSVPEPTSAAFLAVGGLAMLGRRRRQQVRA